jgi:hypothetical protein
MLMLESRFYLLYSSHLSMLRKEIRFNLKSIS